MKNLIIVVVILMAVVLIPSAVLASGVSSINNQSTLGIEKTNKSQQSISQERKLISTAIKGFYKKHGIERIRNVHAKLTDARITLAPEQLRKYLVLIKEILVDEYSIEPVPTAEEIQSRSTVPEAKKKLIIENSKEESSTENSLILKQEKKVTEEKSEPKIQSLNIDVEIPFDSGIRMSQGGDIYQLQNGTIDIGVLQTTRLQRVNQVRKERGRKTIQLSSPLHSTAEERSQTMKKKGVADHRRFSSSSYYNYGQLVDWFENRGITFVNVQRATFTENIGYGRLTCTQGDCTQSAIKTMRTVFDYFISEEGTTYDAHRRTIIHPNFKIMGLGIAVDESKKRLYITQHYGTQIK